MTKKDQDKLAKIYLEQRSVDPYDHRKILNDLRKIHMACWELYHNIQNDPRWKGIGDDLYDTIITIGKYTGDYSTDMLDD